MLTKEIGFFLSLSLFPFPYLKVTSHLLLLGKISGSPVGFQPMKLMGLTLCLFPFPGMVWEPQIQVTGCHSVAFFEEVGD